MDVDEFSVRGKLDSCIVDEIVIATHYLPINRLLAQVLLHFYIMTLTEELQQSEQFNNELHAHHIILFDILFDCKVVDLLILLIKEFILLFHLFVATN